jgi:nitrogen regulatory protein PII
MHFHPMILVTIVCQEQLVPAVADILQRRGATGYTTAQASGLSFGKEHHPAPRQRVEVIVSREEADAILEEIYQRDFHSGSFILWTTEVKVLRRSRFVR